MTQAAEPGAPGPGGRPGRGGPPPAFFLIGLVGILVGLAVIVAQVLGGGADEGRAAAPQTMAPPGEPAAATRQLVAAALAAQGLQVTDPQTPYRPGESASLTDVPRRLLQAVLPS